MTPAESPSSVVDLRSALAPARSELSALAVSQTADVAAIAAAQRPAEALLARCAPSVSRLLSQRIVAALSESAGDRAGILRALRLMDEVDAELALRQAVASYRRSAPRALVAAVFWLLAVSALAGGLVSLAVAVIVVRAPEAGDLYRQAFSAVSFYGLLAMCLASIGLALWRRRDPRPRTLSGRRLSVIAGLSLVVLVVSTVALSAGSPLPILSSSLRYEVAGVASVLPPGTTGWEAKRTKEDLGERVEFSRDVGSRQRPEDNETLRAHIAALATTGNLLSARELLQQALDTEDLSREGGRLAPVSFTVTTVPSLQQCQRYDRVTTDRGVTEFPGSVFLLTFHGVFCADEAAGQLISAQWSHRYLQGATPVVPESEADSYLASLQLRPSSGSARPSSDFAPAGRVVFSDRFGDRTTGWSLHDNEYVRTSYLDGGGYGVQLRKPAFAHVGTRAVQPSRDTYVEVELALPQDVGGFYGPTCRVDDALSSFYLFAVTSDGRYSIVRMANGQPTPLAEAASTARRSIAAPATLRIGAYCYGGPGEPVTLGLVVNGVPLLKVEDRNGAIDREGRTGLLVNSTSAGPLIRMSRFDVREVTR